MRRVDYAILCLVVCLVVVCCVLVYMWKSPSANATRPTKPSPHVHVIHEGDFSAEGGGQYKWADHTAVIVVDDHLCIVFEDGDAGGISCDWRAG